MKQPDLNHLRRELTTQQQRVLQIIEAGIARGTPPTRREIANEMGFRSANAADEHVRALATLGFIVVEPGKARNIRPANDVPKGGAAMLRATAESRAVIDVAPGATAGPALTLSDLAMEQGLAEVGITAWGPRAQDWAAGAEYALRLMRRSITPAATERAPNRLNAAGDAVACRDMQAGPPTLRRDDAGGVDATLRGPEETANNVLIKKRAADLGNRDWKWWDSNSFRRLTFEDGQDRRDGSALQGTMQASDGHPDVNMAAGVREFIEAASPFAVGKLCNALAEKDRDLQGMRAVLTDLINECERADVQAAGEVQRLFIHPHVVELARRALGGRTEASSC